MPFSFCHPMKNALVATIDPISSIVNLVPPKQNLINLAFSEHGWP